MKQKKHFLAVGLLALTGLLSVATEAATITFSPLASNVAAGDEIQIMLVGRDFTDGEGGTFGGGVSVAWNPALLSLESYDTGVFAGDKFLASSNTLTVIDNNLGTLANLSVASFFTGVESADFDIAILNFRGLAAGQTTLEASIGYFTSGFENIWTDASDFSPIALEPVFGTAAVTVTAVPVPAAAWLMGSGLVGLAGVARRRKVNG